MKSLPNQFLNRATLECLKISQFSVTFKSKCDHSLVIVTWMNRSEIFYLWKLFQTIFDNYKVYIFDQSIRAIKFKNIKGDLPSCINEFKAYNFHLTLYHKKGCITANYDACSYELRMFAFCSIFEAIFRSHYFY